MIPEIQPITKTDIPVLVELINLSYRTDNENAWTTESHLFNEGGKRIDEQELESVLSDSRNHIFKYETNETILGTVSLTEKTDSIYLGTLAVSPVSQGLGIGKKLLNAAKEFAQEKRKSKISLTVISSRKELIAWYERYGYQMTGVTTPFPAKEHTLSTPVEDLFFEEMALYV